MRHHRCLYVCAQLRSICMLGGHLLATLLNVYRQANHRNSTILNSTNDTPLFGQSFTIYPFSDPQPSLPAPFDFDRNNVVNHTCRESSEAQIPHREANHYYHNRLGWLKDHPTLSMVLTLDILRTAVMPYRFASFCVLLSRWLSVLFSVCSLAVCPVMSLALPLEAASSSATDLALSFCSFASMGRFSGASSSLGIVAK